MTVTRSSQICDTLWAGAMDHLNPGLIKNGVSQNWQQLLYLRKSQECHWFLLLFSYSFKLYLMKTIQFNIVLIQSMKPMSCTVIAGITTCLHTGFYINQAQTKHFSITYMKPQRRSCRTPWLLHKTCVDIDSHLSVSFCYHFFIVTIYIFQILLKHSWEIIGVWI